jgi:hypothetical protein
LQVKVVDIVGNIVTSASPLITLTLHEKDSWREIPSGNLSGACVQQAKDGVAEFNGLAVDTPGLSFLITASSSIPAIDPCTAVFNVTAHLTCHIIVQDGKTTTAAWDTFMVKVKVCDLDGNIVDSVGTPPPLIRLQIQDGCPSKRLGGGAIALHAYSGTVEFVDLLIDTPGLYQLLAFCDNDAIADAISPPFEIEPPRNT